MREIKFILGILVVMLLHKGCATYYSMDVSSAKWTVQKISSLSLRSIFQSEHKDTEYSGIKNINKYMKTNLEYEVALMQKFVGESKNTTGRRAKIGVFAMAANPVHGGHMEPAFSALFNIIQKAEVKGKEIQKALNVDKIYFIIAAEDVRKPDLLPEAVRYPMFQYYINRYPDLFEFCGIAKGTGYDGETNIFRLMELNKDLEADWFYMVGSDHAFVYKEKVTGKIIKIEDDKITIKVSSGHKVTKKTENEKIKAETEVTYNMKTPEFSLIKGKLKTGENVTVRKLDTIGKLERNFENGAPLRESKEEDQTANANIKKHTIKVAFIGRDPAELQRNLKKAKEQGQTGEVEILTIEQNFPFSSTQIRNAFKGKDKNGEPVSIGYLWPLGLSTLAYIASCVEYQQKKGYQAKERLYQISDEVLNKMIQLRNDAVDIGLIKKPIIPKVALHKKAVPYKNVFMNKKIVKHRVNNLWEIERNIEYDSFECDVQLLKDKEIAVYHDPTVIYKGVEIDTCKLTFSQLKSSYNKEKRNKNNNVLLFNEYLKIIKEKKKKIIVHILNWHSYKINFYDLLLIKNIAKIIKNIESWPRIIDSFLSFSSTQLFLIKKYFCGIPTIICIKDDFNFITQIVILSNRLMHDLRNHKINHISVPYHWDCFFFVTKRRFLYGSNIHNFDLDGYILDDSFNYVKNFFSSR
jgi:hypothetical protein